MIPTELHHLLTASGYSCRMARDEVQLEVCVFCGNTKHNLELSATKGVYHCWACKQSGRLDALLRKITGEAHHIPTQRFDGKKKQGPLLPATKFASQQIAHVESAGRYLMRRGIFSDTAAAYELVVCTEPGHLLEGRIAIPARDYWTGVVVGWVGRTYTNQNPKYLSTLPRKVITGWRQRVPTTPVILVEGALDGINVHRAGFQAAVLGGTSGVDVVEWASRLPASIAVGIMLDADALQAAQRLYWELKPVHAQLYIIPSPEGKDPGSMRVEEISEALSVLQGTNI